MNSNLDWYSKFAPCPEGALREIKAGNLKGKSDINPVWRIKTLTEHFGPVGFGWYTKTVEHWVEHDDGEAAAWVRIELYVKHPETGEWSMPIEGIGGNKQCGKGKGDGINDEAFKMAETDAISVACKKLGVAANVYWQTDRTKYTRYTEQHPEQPAAPRKTVVRKQAAPKPAQQAAPGLKTITEAMLATGELNQLAAWMTKRYDAATGRFAQEAVDKIYNSYAWESETVFSRFMAEVYNAITQQQNS